MNTRHDTTAAGPAAGQRDDLAVAADAHDGGVAPARQGDAQDHAHATIGPSAPRAPQPLAGRLAHRCAVVTGAGGPMGLAVARRFAAEGAALMLTDISAARLGAAADALREAFPDIALASLRADVRVHHDVEAIAATIARELPPVDILVNVVGGLRGPFQRSLFEIDAGRWDETMDLNLKGTLLLTRRLAPNMLARGYGRIVNFCSISYAGEAGQADYGAAKAAVASLTRSMALELAPHINVNCVAPGLIETSVIERMDPATVERYRSGCALGRLGKADEIANVVLFLASEEASFVTGEIVHVAGGRWPSL